jgi:hypothetical protein
MSVLSQVLKQREANLLKKFVRSTPLNATAVQPVAEMRNLVKAVDTVSISRAICQ